MKKVQLVTEAPRRRRFSEEFKATVLAEISEKGVTIASVARRHDVSQSLIHHWKRKAETHSGFVRILPETNPTSRDFHSTVRIASPSGALIEIVSPMSLHDIAGLLRVLEARA